ncbi:MAG: hypothetical protein KJ052_13440, partial [Candidatus Hydrogenedentes bacterium]|nr:hypothetical protein [Candidatus Hydrogenedentota bacterium]
MAVKTVLHNPWVQALALLGALVLLVFLAYSLSFVLVPLFLAFIVAYLLDPVVEKLNPHVKKAIDKLEACREKLKMCVQRWTERLPKRCREKLKVCRRKLRICHNKLNKMCRKKLHIKRKKSKKSKKGKKPKDSRGVTVSILAIIGVLFFLSIPLFIVPSIIHQADALVQASMHPPGTEGDEAAGLRGQLQAYGYSLMDRLPLDTFVEMMGWGDPSEEDFDAEVVIAVNIAEWVRENARSVLTEHFDQIRTAGAGAGKSLAGI